MASGSAFLSVWLWLRRGLLLVIVVLAGGVTYQQLGQLADLRRYPPPGELVSAGDFRLHVHCEGVGEPTVIAEAGFGDFSVSWRGVSAEISQETRICAYDRAGFGWSDFDDAAPTRQRIAQNLHTALDNAGIDDPYILVGHSLGGIYVREFAQQYPDGVSGIVLVDSSHENQVERMPEELESEQEQALSDFRSDLRRCQLLAPIGVVRALGSMSGTLPASIPERTRAEIVATRNRTHYCKAMAAALVTFSGTFARGSVPRNLGDLPLIVLSRGMPDAQPGDSPDAVEAWERTWSALQTELAALSSASEHRIVGGAGHYIQVDQPGAVVNAIRDIIGMVR